MKSFNLKINSNNPEYCRNFTTVSAEFASLRVLGNCCFAGGSTANDIGKVINGMSLGEKIIFNCCISSSSVVVVRVSK